MLYEFAIYPGVVALRASGTTTGHRAGRGNNAKGERAHWGGRGRLFSYIGLSGILVYTSSQSIVWRQTRCDIAASGGLLIFDGGGRSADVSAARAAYDQSVANYRQTVLTAFRDVEDALSGV